MLIWPSMAHWGRTARCMRPLPHQAAAQSHLRDPKGNNPLIPQLWELLVCLKPKSNLTALPKLCVVLLSFLVHQLKVGEQGLQYSCHEATGLSKRRYVNHFHIFNNSGDGHREKERTGQ
jgi:hypothetical protein